MRLKLLVLLLILCSLTLAVNSVQTIVCIGGNCEEPAPVPAPEGGFYVITPPPAFTQHKETMPVGTSSLVEKTFYYLYKGIEYTFDYTFSFEQVPELKMEGGLKEYIVEDSIQLDKNHLSFKIKIPSDKEITGRLDLTLEISDGNYMIHEMYAEAAAAEFDGDIFFEYIATQYANSNDIIVTFRATPLESAYYAIKLDLPENVPFGNFEFSSKPNKFFYSSTHMIWNLALDAEKYADMSFNATNVTFHTLSSPVISYSKSIPLTPFEISFVGIIFLIILFLVFTFIFKSSKDYNKWRKMRLHRIDRRVAKWLWYRKK